MEDKGFQETIIKDAKEVEKGVRKMVDDITKEL